jgi:putative transposase
VGFGRLGKGETITHQPSRPPNFSTERNRRWCSDGPEIGRDNGERVRVACALDWLIGETMSFLATTAGICGDDVQDLMVAAVESQFGRVYRLPDTIEWLSNNGSCYIAGDTRSFD